jgi:PKD repeat protein
MQPVQYLYHLQKTLKLLTVDLVSNKIISAAVLKSILMKKIFTSLFVVILAIQSFAAGHTINTTVYAANCSGACTGAINTTVTGGVGPFSYHWSPSVSTTANAASLCPGTYNLMVIDSSDMSTASVTAVVNAPTPPAVAISLFNGCGPCSATLSATNIMGATYSWTGSSPLTGGHTVTGVCDGTYTVTVSVGVCTNSASTAVSAAPLPTVTLPASTDLCIGACTNLVPSVTGGTGPYNYLWSPGTYLSTTTTTTTVACPLTTASFTLAVTDMNGCVGTAWTTVNVSSLPVLTMSSIAASGCGACDGEAEVIPTGSGPFTYAWTNGVTLADNTMLCPGNYVVQVTDALGCQEYDTVDILEYPAVIANFTMVPDSANPNEFWTFNSSSGSSYYTWDFGDGSTSALMNPSHTYATPGTYNVCLTAWDVCGSDTVCQTVNAGTPASCLALFNIGDDTVSTNPDDHYVYNLSYGSSLSYFWDFGDGTTSTLMTPSHIYSGAGPYQLCLTVDNGAGCVQTYCDSLFSADSLNRSGNISLVTYDVAAPGDITTGVSDLQSLKVSVYPQPGKDLVNFSWSKVSGDVTIQLTDLAGRSVKIISLGRGNSGTVDISDLAAGTYIYRMIVDGNVYQNGYLSKQ